MACKFFSYEIKNHGLLYSCSNINSIIMQNYGSLVAVCDTNKNKADEFGKKHNTSIFYSIEDLIDTIEHINRWASEKIPS